MCSADSEILWRKEGQKLASTNPRFVARQLSHLPQLLTSAAVSSALGIQSSKTDPDLRKSTSVQVQNVLKFIISQNPLNAASAAKQQLGKVSLPTAVKSMVKSPSKSPAVSGPYVATTTPSSQRSTILPTTSPATASPIKMVAKEEKVAITTSSRDSTRLPSPAKAVSTPVARAVTTLMKSDPMKLIKVGGASVGGKPSMLVGLLEGKMSGCETPSPASTVSHDTRKNVIPADEKEGESVEEEPLEVKEGKMVSGATADVVLKENKESKEFEVNIAKQPGDKKDGGTEAVKQNDTVIDGSQAETPEREKGEERDKPVVASTELVCEEMMPKFSVSRDQTLTPVASSASETTEQPSSEPEKSSSKSHTLTVESVAMEEAERPGSIPEAVPQVQQCVNEQTEETSNSAGLTAIPREEPWSVESVLGSRKRPCPTDLSLPPSKKTHLPPTSSPCPPKISSPLPLPVPILTPVPVTTQARSADPSPVVQSSITSTVPVPQSPSRLTSPPPLLLIPPSSDVGQEATCSSGEEGDKETSVSLLPQVESATAALSLFGAVTIQPLLHSLPATSGASPSLAPETLADVESGVRVGQISPHTVIPPQREAPSAGVPHTGLLPPPLPSPSTSPLSSLTAQPSPAETHATFQLIPTTTSLTTPLQVESPLQLLPLESAPLQASSLTTPNADLELQSAGTATSDEALIRELCSEATEDTTAAALASQLGLGFLEQSFLGGMDLMQLVQSPFETKPGDGGSLSIVSLDSPAATQGMPPLQAVDIGLGGEGEGWGDTPVLPDTTQLLSEALTSLSTPSTPILPPSSLPRVPPLHPALFPPSPTVLPAGCPVLPPQSIERPAPGPPSILTPHSSPFTPHTPSILTPHTPSMSSPLTPEILPDLESLSSVNEADLLEGIPPELAETIQALARFDQQNYQSPLQ